MKEEAVFWSHFVAFDFLFYQTESTECEMSIAGEEVGCLKGGNTVV